MTPVRKTKREVVLNLTYAEIENIAYNMGWEPEDADAFWLLALKLKKHGAL